MAYVKLTESAGRSGAGQEPAAWIAEPAKLLNGVAATAPKQAGGTGRSDTRGAPAKCEGVDTRRPSSYDGCMRSTGSAASDETALKQAMGRAIALARVKAGFPTQAAFSRAINVRFQYVSRVEKGDENLTLETLARMTAVLGVTMPEFLTNVADEMREPTRPPPPRPRRQPAD